MARAVLFGCRHVVNMDGPALDDRARSQGIGQVHRDFPRPVDLSALRCRVGAHDLGLRCINLATEHKRRIGRAAELRRAPEFRIEHRLLVIPALTDDVEDLA